MQRKFKVDFQSTDDASLDAELIVLEDELRTIEEIQDICRRYGVRARVFGDHGELVGEVERDGSLGKRPTKAPP